MFNNKFQTQNAWRPVQRQQLGQLPEFDRTSRSLIHARLLDRDTKEPIEGIQVTGIIPATESRAAIREVAYTDKDGVFVMAFPVPAGTSATYHVPGGPHGPVITVEGFPGPDGVQDVYVTDRRISWPGTLTLLGVLGLTAWATIRS